jgi:hypothetical protein
MLELAVGRAGITPALFWQSTPYEVSLMMEKYANDRREQQKDILTHAWVLSNLVWAKKRPKLETLLKGLDEPKQRKKKTSDKELKALAKQKGLNCPW